MLSVYALIVFKSFKCFSLCYTIINFLFASLKLLTNSENSYCNPPQNSLLCDVVDVSSIDPSLAAGKMCQNLLDPGSFGKILQDLIRHPVCNLRVNLGSRKRVTERMIKIRKKTQGNFKTISAYTESICLVS